MKGVGMKWAAALIVVTALVSVALVGVGRVDRVQPDPAGDVERVEAQRAATGPGAQGYLTGVVESARGPEAGVWVIAETRDLPTGFIKIVVTDDRGRFTLPDLPAANYSVWVRGYGLVDSAPIRTKPAATPVTLKAALASTPQEAARV